MINLDHYQTIIFDCDGVILNSNFQKIEAYRNAALEFGASKEQAESLVQHHVCLLYTSPSPRDKRQSRMPSSA